MNDDDIRFVSLLDDGWLFKKGDMEVSEVAKSSQDWEPVAIPHDWAIYGPFDREHDMQETTIWEDGERVPSFHAGRTGGLPHVGTAWYTRKLDILPAFKEKRVFIEFDGVMSHSSVYLNGEFVDSWPFGYSSFRFELTKHIDWDGENHLSVKVDNRSDASRWYPGAGIYRDVRLVVLHPVHVDQWGTYITCPQIREDSADIDIKTTICNQSEHPVQIDLETIIVDQTGETVAKSRSVHDLPGKKLLVEQIIELEDPIRWDVDEPVLYQAISTVSIDDELTDVYITPFGIREISFSSETGFMLNGRSLKMNGVCMHHDLGALGAAFNYRALERQLEILEDMGCNAIRTSHNPPAPELLELCDQMGFLVIDEAFDEWKAGKIDNGYHILFDQWAEKDLRALIKRDRNHPSVILWSIGNEIGEQALPDGAEVARFLVDIAHDEDPTRLVTAGFNSPDNAIKNGLADAVDVPGWNYEPDRYQEFHEAHPEWIMYGSETASCLSTRGEYYFPVEDKVNQKWPSLKISSYDITAPGWGNPPDYEFAAQDDCPFILGEFVWTGFDYLGEPTPYKTEWPSRSAYFGIVDLCGNPKDRFYLYQSQWTDKPVLHLLPHWNWPERVGEVTPVHCYTSFDSAELFLNGKSLGIRKKDPDSEWPLARYRLIWDDVTYEPGELKVVAFDQDGNVVREACVRTASEPSQITLEVDRDEIAADGKDLAFVKVTIHDADGNICPLAENTVEFTVDGAGCLRAVDNGDQTSLESFHASSRKAFHGICNAIVASCKDEGGEISITAESEGLSSATIKVKTTKPE